MVDDIAKSVPDSALSRGKWEDEIWDFDRGRERMMVIRYILSGAAKLPG